MIVVPEPTISPTPRAAMVASAGLPLATDFLRGNTSGSGSAEKLDYGAIDGLLDDRDGQRPV